MTHLNTTLSMRAVTQQSFGGPEVLEIANVPRPSPLPTEVLVRVKAAGVNPVDGIIRQGIFPLIGQPPFVLGWDVSGVVEEVVPGTTRFRPGDEVYGMPFFPRAANGYAEFVAAPSRQLALKPRSLSHAEAASLPLAGLTAWQSLVDIANVQPGQRVLVHGAGGGVGHLAVQIAKHRGAFVIATASAGKHAFLKSLGVDELVDYRSVDFTRVVSNVDVVLELIGGDYAQRSLGVLREGGLLVTAVERTNLALRETFVRAGRRFEGVAVEPDYRALEQLAALVDEGVLRPHLSHQLPLEQVREAHALLETNLTGKIVLSL